MACYYINSLSEVMTKAKAYSINLQLFIVIGINISVVATVFVTHNLKFIFSILLMSKWCMLGALHSSLASVEIETRVAGKSRAKRLCLSLLPFHLLFTAALIACFVPGIGASCSDVVDWPKILLIIEFSFYASAILIWALYVIIICRSGLGSTSGFDNR